ncbi:NADH-quinone oxidoreductase subunit C [Streptomyces uncialis]|uniref:NADH-quinone oxidoreductase subunit C n=1 Tax=Streptomyces uncialis TaxID=1048205 RepID=UPI003867C12D|nr:NADH-quinone oxidoreductase subunit C [Streptomyces uncialis]
MTGWLPAPAEELFGPEATADESYDLLTVDVPAASWITALETARTTLGCTYFDWLSAVDEGEAGFRVSAHVVALGPVRRLLVRTAVPREAAVLPSAVGVYAGAAWHERETHEMFGVGFDGHPGLDPLLLPETFEGHPLRKDFVLAARVVKAWPGAKEPGESEHGGPKRRQMLPPGVPDPNEWGPLKGQLPPAPARPARGAAGRAGGAAARAAGDRPVRRARTTPAGSAGTAGTEPGTGAAADTGAPVTGAAPGTGAPATGATGTPASDGSTGTPTSGTGTDTGAGTTAEPGARPARRARSVSGGSASQRPEAAPAPDAAPAPESGSPQISAPTASGDSAADTSAESAAPAAAPRTGSPDAPWHHARPAFDESRPTGDSPPATERGTTGPGTTEPAATEPEVTEPEATKPDSGSRTEDKADDKAEAKADDKATDPDTATATDDDTPGGPQ